ncbi:glycoside hydrolase [Collybia nuda]|uniref:alpha-1,2-Mannosidase n=1 Tax=Collybia nuda TaxID=64659 RepID=A0A9P5YC98_9AGAR|nr:glycoside hydrolase [Collybia nuda]
MLPTHVRRPLYFAEPASAGPPTLRRLTARPLLRWISLILICVGTLWFFTPTILDLWRPPIHVPAPSSPIDDEPHSYEGAPTIPEPPPIPQILWEGRASKVRDAFVHAYSGYQKHALPFDELLPLGGGATNNFNGWGVSVFDAMDTMWIMGLEDMFRQSVEVAAKSTFALQEGFYAPFFETVIRYLGGLLSAYALSKEPVLLARADDLGRMLLPAFNTTSGFPMYAVNTITGQTRPGWSGHVLWAEALSNQIEYKYLAHLTGRTEYFEKTEHIMRKMYRSPIKNGQYPTMWDIHSGTPSNSHFSVGAFADSAHEYLLKQWLLTSQSEPKARELYLNSVSAILNTLLYITPTRHLLYVTDTQNGKPTHTFEHLSCFLPGLLALGVHTLELSAGDRELHLWAAEGLAYTCWVSYADQASGLGPDEMRMKAWKPLAEGRWMVHVERWKEEGRPGGIPPGLAEGKMKIAGERDYNSQKSAYLLRPEAIESFYLMWRTTGDKKWRDRGWAVFEAIEKHARTPYGYAAVGHVDMVPPPLMDSMPSYFLAETLKYLFLLFTNDDLIPLKDWVFNTEAHPIPIFQWKDWERKQYKL